MNIVTFFYIAGTIFFTVYGQVIMKWRVAKYGSLPEQFTDKLLFLVKVIFDPFILSGFLAAFIASMFWIAAMTRVDLSYAYPFMSFSFILVLAISALLFAEPVTVHKLAGMSLIVMGIFVTSKSL